MTFRNERPERLCERPPTERLIHSSLKKIKSMGTPFGAPMPFNSRFAFEE